VENENQDLMQHLAALHGHPSYKVIPEDSEEESERVRFGNSYQPNKSYNPNHLGKIDERVEDNEDNDSETFDRFEQGQQQPRKESDEIEQKQFSATVNGKGGFYKNTNFRIRTTNNFKDAQKPAVPSDYRSPSEEQKVQPAQNLTNSTAFEKSKTMTLEVEGLKNYSKYENLKYLESRMEKEGFHKKVPLKLANGVVGTFGRANDPLWTGQDGGIMLAIKSLDIERNVNKYPVNSVSKRVPQRNEMKGKFFTRKQQSPPPG